MYKKLGVILLALIATVSVVYSLNSTLHGATLPNPIIYVEGKEHSSSSDARMNQIDWEEGSPTLDFSRSGQSHILFSQYDPSVLTMMASVSMPQIPTATEFIFGNAQSGGAFIVASASGNYTVSLYINGAYHSIGGSAIVPDQEVTIIVTYDGRNIHYYENGVLLASVAVSGAIAPSTENTVWAIGANPKGNDLPTTSQQFFSGKLKNAAVYGQAFSASEVKQLQDEITHLYNPELTFVNDGEAVEELEDISENQSLSVANKYDLSDVKNQDLSFCILDEEDRCDGMSSDVLDIKDHGDGTISTLIHKGGSVKLQVENSEDFVSGTYLAKGILTLEVKDLDIEFSELPQNSMTHFEYGKNVSPNMTIGKIAFENFYQEPLSISLKPSIDVGHSEDVQNFEVVSTSSSISPVNIRIKENGAPNIVNGSLKAGTYKFKVEVVDGTSSVSEDVSITVLKTTPTLSFADTSQKNMKVGDPQVSGTILSDNSDEITMADVVYSLTGDISDVLTTSRDANNPLQYNLEIVSSHSGSGLPASYTLRASLKETENFNAITTTQNRRIYAYKELHDLVWAPRKGSFHTTEVDRAGVEVGSLLAQAGIAPFQYEIVASTDEFYDPKKGEDGGSFQVSEAKLEAGIAASVKSNFALVAKEYHIQFKVSDGQGDISYCDAILSVTAKGQADLDFKDQAGGNTITSTGMSISYDEQNAVLLAEGGSTSNVVEYDYAPREMQPDGLNPADYATINKISGLITPICTGKIKVQAKRAGDATYSEVISYMDLNIEVAPQTITFLDTSAIVNIALNQQKLMETKGTILSSGAQGVGKIRYSSSDESIATVDEVGNVTGIALGSITLSATMNDPDKDDYNPNYETVSCRKEIKIYEGLSATFTPMGDIQAETMSSDFGAKAGALVVDGGVGTKHFRIEENGGVKNKDASLFKVNENGILSFSKRIAASDLVNSYDINRQSYVLYVQVKSEDSSQNSIITDMELELKGAPLHAEFDTDGTGILQEEYGLHKSFILSLAHNPGGALPSYRLKNDPSMPSDVLSSVEATGLVHIQHANDKESNANDVVVEAVIPPNNGYEGETIAVVVEISKASQPDFAFKTPNMKLGYEAYIQPIFQGNLASSAVTMSSSNESLVHIDQGQIVAGNRDGEVKVTAIQGGDRDYKSATATGIVQVRRDPAYNFGISVPSATYGDVDKQATLLFNEATGSDVQRTWSSSNPEIAEVDNDGYLSIHKVGSTDITCIQTSTGEPSVSDTASFVIKPKPIIVSIEDARKYVGEAMPSFYARIPSEQLVGSDTLTQPIFSCMKNDENVDRNTVKGNYTIQGSYASNTHPNYNISVTSATLAILQEESKASWFQSIGAKTNQSIKQDTWVNEDVKIQLKDAQASVYNYNQISMDQRLWMDEEIQLNEEGNHSLEVFFRNYESQALSTAQNLNLKIDKTKPEITSITGEPTQRNALEELLHTLSFGNYFKPNLKVQIEASDPLVEGVDENSGIASIHYEVYEKQTNGTISDIIQSGDFKEHERFSLANVGSYLVCATTKDHAGNISKESCSSINIRNIGEDSDADGLPDLNIDTNGDGVPDLNITKKPGDKKPWTNIDTDGDGLPDMNIDVTPFDGIPNLNTGIISEWICDLEADLDNDGIADYKTSSTLKGLNNIDTDHDNYPDVNIDLDLDGLPSLNINTDGSLARANINIDGNGDGIADINLDTGTEGNPEDTAGNPEDTKGNPEDTAGNPEDTAGNPEDTKGNPEDGIADKNIIEIGEWKPDLDAKIDGTVRYDTMSLQYLTKDKLEDNGVVIKPTDPNKTFLPNYALKVKDITNDTSDATKDEILRKAKLSNGEVKVVYDVKVLEDNKVIQPDGSVEISVPVDPTIKNPKVLMKSKDGTWVVLEGRFHDGKFIFQTDYIGEVSVVGDKEKQEVIKEEVNSSVVKNTKPNVQESYPSGMGGASTGDTSQVVNLVGIMILTSLVLWLLSRKLKQMR